jgi:hypothetical protein
VSFIAWDTTKVAGDLISSSDYNAQVSDQKSRVLKSGDTMTGTLTVPTIILGTITGIVKAVSGTLSAIANGAANQILGMDAAGTGYEYKTVAGTSNQITATHAANAITFSLPTPLIPPGVIQPPSVKLPATGQLSFYANDGITEVARLDNDGNLYIKGTISSL